MKTITDFLHMGGYAFYVWTAYGSVIAFLFLQWLMPWRRWKSYLSTLRHCEQPERRRGKPEQSKKAWIATAASQPRDDELELS